MKRIDKIVRSVLLMLLGAMIYGFISSAAEVYGSRGNGNIGGEVLILPLMAGRSERTSINNGAYAPP